jgi:PAS domain-containing protein
MDALGRGEVVAVADVRDDPRVGDPTAYEAASARALVNVPVLEGGRLVALLFVNDARPRAWSAEDVALARDVAERTRTAVERARSAAALRASEARYRALFDSIEAGFCVVEVDADGSRGGAPGRIDHRVVEANPAFYTQTGLPDAILGRWLREAAPALEEHWYETYARVALTGEPLRFERGSEHLGRWFDVYAFRVGEPSEARVAILLNDISTRRGMEERLRESEERFRKHGRPRPGHDVGDRAGRGLRLPQPRVVPLHRADAAGGPRLRLARGDPSGRPGGGGKGVSGGERQARGVPARIPPAARGRRLPLGDRRRGPALWRGRRVPGLCGLRHRHPRAQGGPGGARGARGRGGGRACQGRGGAAPEPEDGGDGQPDRRRGPRLQQPAHADRGGLDRLQRQGLATSAIGD